VKTPEGCDFANFAKVLTGRPYLWPKPPLF
jgi:hypothetical protein